MRHSRNGKAEACSLAFRLIKGLQNFKLTVSLGGTEPHVCHPASTTHFGIAAEVRVASGVTERLTRLSFGLQPSDDLILGLEQAFQCAANSGPN